MLDCLVIIYGQMNSLGSTEYCAELKPQINLTIAQITGKWYVAEVITHRETVYGENLTGDCIKIVINEINEQVSDSIWNRIIYSLIYKNILYKLINLDGDKTTATI